MYYAGGNYEAFARPVRPKGAERKNAYIIGSGLAALSAACFLVRDARMSGGRIHILEKNTLSGGSCDGYRFESIGYVSRGDRQLDNHFECLWDLARSIPSLEDEELTVLDEIYRLNKRDPNYSLCRVTQNRGEDAKPGREYELTDAGAQQIIRLFFLKDEELYNRKISEVLDSDTMNSGFWLYFRSVTGFENWHSALELKRYLRRFVHHIGGLPDMKSMRYTRYNEYESLILPIMSYLEKNGVVFDYGVKVVNVIFDCGTSKKYANRIDVIRNGEEESIDLTDDDLVFITNGSCTENTGMGSQTESPVYSTEIQEGTGWDLWRRISVQDPSFGKPEVFLSAPEHTNWVSATITTLDRMIIPYIKKVCKRDPFTGKVVTGGVVTVKDSSWLLNWTVDRQPVYRDQPQGQAVIWLCGLRTDKPGDYIGKTMKDCSGLEICEEWLYHLGVPEDQIRELAEHHANTVPVIMPYVTSMLMPRSPGDRPAVVPEGAVNFAFIGQYAETPRDAAFTTEYSVRTGMEAVYTLLDIDRAVPEVWRGEFDMETLLDALVRLQDGKRLKEMKLGFRKRMLLKQLVKRLRRSDIMELMKHCGLM